ncbi:MAG TPA: phospholipase D-like domain-containing protein [Bryobacteraceae bacterium]|jgi:phosphatidylserine/phosphatidylglycerophosphate/cardiolipin synthase-like enzyme|nr:phospholipase D-like domain-containing protein [Bryobacteraceae bacterium]
MKLIIQPGDGVVPLAKAIHDAEKSVDILIFRFDRAEIENALLKAVGRGVAVRALIAYTNRGGEKGLRALEMRLLAAGVTVARTDDDLIRYHGKMLIVDERHLYVMGFNFTNLDIERSRSFGVFTDDAKTVQEAVRLFEADSKRQEYEAGLDTFVVSPQNARAVLAEFIKGAKEELAIWDPALTDPAMSRILCERIKAGVKLRVLGRLSKRVTKAESRQLHMRLHTRTIIRDREMVFIGSQSLRTEELDARREVGLIFHDRRIAARLANLFEEDWNQAGKSREKKDKDKDRAAEDAPPPRRVAKKVAKAVAKNIPPVAPVLEVVVREIAGASVEVPVDPDELESTVRDAVKEAVQEAVADAVEQATGK